MPCLFHPPVATSASDEHLGPFSLEVATGWHRPSPKRERHPNFEYLTFKDFMKTSLSDCPYHVLKLTLAVSIAIWGITGCATGPKAPVVVTVNEPPAQGGRFRSPERQRDVWLAPQANGNEVLQHDQTLTYVEKPAAWQLPSTIEPNTVSKPDLPLEHGEYDAEVVRRQKEIIGDTQSQVKRLSVDFEALKKQSTDQLKNREDQLQTLSKQLLQAQQASSQANQRLADIEAAAQLKLKQEEERRAARQWWQVWKK